MLHSPLHYVDLKRIQTKIDCILLCPALDTIVKVNDLPSSGQRVLKAMWYDKAYKPAGLLCLRSNAHSIVISPAMLHVKRASSYLQGFFRSKQGPLSP